MIVANYALFWKRLNELLDRGVQFASEISSWDHHKI